MLTWFVYPVIRETLKDIREECEMKRILFIVFVLINLSLMISCHQNKQEIIQNGESKEEIFSAPLIKNEAAEPTVAENTQTNRHSAVKEEPHMDEPLCEELLEILKNEVEDFSSYEVHPLDKYLGKWNLTDLFGNALETKFSIAIFYEDFQHRYYRKYYDTLTKGRVVLTNTDAVILWPDNIRNLSTLYHLWKPQRTIDGEWTFFVSEEGPVGYFVRIDDEDTFLSRWKIENLNGVWISDPELIDGTLWSNSEKLSLVEELRSAAKTLEFDLEQKTALVPGQGQFVIGSVSKDEEGHICLTVFSPDDEAFDEPILVTIIPLDFAKAYIIHDQWEKSGDRRFSPEEKKEWFRL